MEHPVESPIAQCSESSDYDFVAGSPNQIDNIFLVEISFFLLEGPW